jgi:hypothetical protein
MNKAIFTAAGVLFVTITALIAMRTGSIRAIEDAAARAVIDPASIDFGDIPQGGGVVSTTVSVKNLGDKPLEIFRVSTSCGCTTAAMDTSPMQPKEERPLKIDFDPMVHPDQSGPITRVVYLQTSDPMAPEIEIDITGNVVPSE